MKFEEQRNDLIKLSQLIKEDKISKADREWGGADVVITNLQPELSNNSFYPDSRHVVTKFSLELSWLFNELKDVFSGLIDGMTRIEFYGRLANAGIFYISHSNKNCKELLLSVLHEAFAMLEEFEEGQFIALPIAIGNEIYKEIEQGEKSGYIGIEETNLFFELLLKGGSNE
jgi:hypothetical protein